MMEKRVYKEDFLRMPGKKPRQELWRNPGSGHLQGDSHLDDEGTREALQSWGESPPGDHRCE